MQLPTVEVSVLDLVILCEAIEETKEDWSPTGPYQSMEQVCRFCGVINKQGENFNDIKHSAGCAVLVAQDMSTRL